MILTNKFVWFTTVTLKFKFFVMINQFDFILLDSLVFVHYKCFRACLCKYFVHKDYTLQLILTSPVGHKLNAP